MSEADFVQQFDAVPQFWQFLRGLRLDDLIVELIQNELDANASHTSVVFYPDRLVCQGNGERVVEDGWRRLSYVMGAGDQVERKQFSIGVKNHGLKACFRLGDEIILRSERRRMIQTLYKDGVDNDPSPGTLLEPVLDDTAPSIGCSVEVPYRRKELVVTKGEPLTLSAPKETHLETLFRDACADLPGRLLGVVRPGIRDQYTLCLSHHDLGSVELRWRAKRGRNVNGRGRRRFLVFGRECSTSSDVLGVPSTTIREQACTFRLPFPTGKRVEIPDFFARDRNSFLAEIAWLTDKSGKPKSTSGVRRYPIGYDATSESALTGVGVHFSAPFISDAERRGTSQMDSFNGYIDNACRDALVDIMASYLLHRHGGKAMELYIGDPASPREESLNDLIERTLDRRALPLRDNTLQVAKRFRRRALGPKRTSRDGLRRVVLPMFTWDRLRIAPLLSEICPSDEDQIDRTVPDAILRRLGENCYEPNDGYAGLVTTFDENDAIERLQPQLKAEHFSWKDESEWQAALGNPSIARVYLDVAYETIQSGGLESESEVLEDAYLPDENSTAQPLAEMFSAVNLPPSLGEREDVAILHPEVQHHRVLKRRAWKPRPFTLDDYLDKAQLETASLAKRKSFWIWLRNNWRIVKRQTLIRLSTLPVWPGSNGGLLPLHSLCEPRITRVASIMADATVRPSRDLLRAGLVSRTGRGRLTFRNVPTSEEFEGFLSRRMEECPWERQLTPNERREFRKLEKDLATLVASIPRLRECLAESSEEYSVALDKDGNLRDPEELVRDEGLIQRLHLLDEDIIDRPKGNLDRIDGWGPKASPSTDQIVNTLREDGARHDAHVPRLQEYVRQAKDEGIIPPNALVDLPCIPVEGELRSPNQIALRGRRNFWGDWKIHVPVADVNPEVQRLYKAVGVVGGEPDSTSSRDFFEWLASRDTEVVAKHTDQVLRHISHKSGPHTWSDEFPRVPFILVESNGGRVRLVTKADATKSRSKIVIPDFEQLEEAIRQDAERPPVEMAVVESRGVREPINARLREFGLRTLSDYVGEPVHVVGKGRSKPARSLDFKRVLDSLQSGLKGRQLPKRLAKLGLDAPQSALRSNWRERLSNVRKVETVESVSATYRLGRRRLSVPVDGKLDKKSGTLWVRSDSDLQAAFFDVIADHIFERPQKYYGSVLDRAYKLDMRERYPLEYADDVQLREDVEIDETTGQDGEGRGPAATSGVHAIPEPDPSRNVPNPGQVPTADGIIEPVSTGSGGANRPHSATEDAQVVDLKENQYAWHCQACIAGSDPKTLAPSLSYVAVPENRRLIMQAHHCDHVNAGGARHVGNILLLCHYHHRALGDAVTRTEVTRAFDQAGSRRLTFSSENGVSNSLQGKIVTIHPPQRQNPVSLFFTKEHADYWVAKADE